MTLHKILKIVAAILGLAGIILLVMIIAKGDEAIKAAAAAGDTSTIDPIAWVAYITLGLIVTMVVIFVFQSLFTHPESLKSTLIGVGLFVLVFVVAYFASGGDDTTYFYNNRPATDAQSHLVGTGLIAFYIFAVAAIVLMLVSGARKLIK